MNMLKYVGLIECNTSVLPYKLDVTSRLDGFHIKKVFLNNNITEDAASTAYPEAEIVQDMNSIIDDKAIELVIVSGSGDGCLIIAAQALKAGKHVRMNNNSSHHLAGKKENL